MHDEANLSNAVCQDVSSGLSRPARAITMTSIITSLSRLIIKPKKTVNSAETWIENAHNFSMAAIGHLFTVEASLKEFDTTVPNTKQPGEFNV